MSIRSRVGTAFPSLILVSGAVILLFLLILAGAYDRRPLNEIFFLQADTKGIPNAPQGMCHWTLYNFCDERHGKNINCRPNQAAYPFLPQRNFNTEINVPHGFIDNPGRYFYLSRFLYAFYIIDVVFASLALLAGLLALCFRLGGAAAALFSAIALFCVTFSACIMTACFVLGQRLFKRAGRRARVGVKAFAFTWTCVALLTLATIGFLISFLAGRNKNKYVDRNRTSKWAGMRRHRNMGHRYDEKRVSDGTTDGYYTGGRADSQRRLNPTAVHPDVQLNAPAVPVSATGHGYETGVSGYDARR